jgi:hypothetical protein
MHLRLHLDRLGRRRSWRPTGSRERQEPPDVAADAHLGCRRFLVVAQLQPNFGKLHAKRVKLEQKLDHAGKTASNDQLVAIAGDGLFQDTDARKYSPRCRAPDE